MRRWISTIRVGVLVASASALLLACGGPLKFAPKGTPKAPEADAHVVADVDTGANMTHLTVDAEHLAPPGRLQPGGTTYVLWARKNDGGVWQRIGALVYDEGSRKAQLKDVTVPLVAFDLVISIEKQAAPESPSADVVISQRVQN